MSRLISTHRELCILKQFSAVADFRAIELQFPSRGRCFRFRNDGSIQSLLRSNADCLEGKLCEPCQEQMSHG